MPDATLRDSEAVQVEQPRPDDIAEPLKGLRAPLNGPASIATDSTDVFDDNCVGRHQLRNPGDRQIKLVAIVVVPGVVIERGVALAGRAGEEQPHAVGSVP